MLKNPYIVTFSTWGVLLLELLIAISVFLSSQRYKQMIFLAAGFFHLFIGVFFGLWSFYFAMLGLLIYILFNSFEFNYGTKIFTKI
ncbi:hypothetical protein CGC58_04515 [Capnocytophaga stomatis]|uniref:Uncharacterized protein n=1 Tax=Capnocytophaga stomatis TaxID=1848904 RepID=A0A250FVJ5_9FLAO|nr:hypothetical protein CGC58_04515 [Capnocytophaga stomatis]